MATAEIVIKRLDTARERFTDFELISMIESEQDVTIGRGDDNRWSFPFHNIEYVVVDEKTIAAKTYVDDLCKSAAESCADNYRYRYTTYSDGYIETMMKDGGTYQVSLASNTHNIACWEADQTNPEDETRPSGDYTGFDIQSSDPSVLSVRYEQGIVVPEGKLTPVKAGEADIIITIGDCSATFHMVVA